MSPTLLTTHALTSLAGDPHTLIRLRNLQTVLPVGTDAWGRPNIPQPVLISASISLSRPFASASDNDAVTGSTVHYGVLSKAILGACGELGTLGKAEGGAQRAGGGSGEKSLYALVMYLQAFITGVVSTLQEGEEDAGAGMHMLEVEVRLPKASLLGSGVSLKGSFVYHDQDKEEAGREKKGPSAHSMVLGLEGLKIPTLIGVNPNERLAKQVVVADIGVERWDQIEDSYTSLEALIVKCISESSFETLEALTSHLGTAITRYIYTHDFEYSDIINFNKGEGSYIDWNKIRIALAKPTAVMFADAPVVEVLLETDPSKSKELRQLWDESTGVLIV